MKGFLPYILLGIGLLAAILAFFFIANSKKTNEKASGEESSLIDVAPEDLPKLSLVPSSDGHYLLLKIDNIVLPAATLDYELLYQTKDNITQGVPGTVVLEEKDMFEVDLLLGSESSGKFRYDEGVETGSITLRFRNSSGKLIARFTTDFHLQTGVSKVSSQDGTFEYNLDGVKSSAYFVTLKTIGELDSSDVVVSRDGYSVFSSEVR